MCSVAGILGPGADRLADSLERMNLIQSHRGPDGDGVLYEPCVALGHRRLAIIDLSNSARQPMASRDGRYVIVFNGEIYNYRELRQELGGRTRFQTESDTEVLLEAYTRWGEKCLDHLRGMFAFAIWDRKTRQVFIARDRFGIKPLYYTKHNGLFYFASEIKAILAAGVPFSPDMKTVGRHLRDGLVDAGEDTFFAHIHRLPPGHAMRIGVDECEFRKWCWYDLRDRAAPMEIGFDDAKEQLLSILTQTIKLHLRSDVPVGVNISGGVDSAALLSLVSSAWPGHAALRGFSMDYTDERYSERRWVNDVIETTRTQCHFTYVDEEACLGALDAMIWHQDEPFGGVPTLAWYALFDAARSEGVTVLLDGSGVDDILAGYKPEVLVFLASLNEAGDSDAFEIEAEGYCRVWGCTTDELMQDLARSTNHKRSRQSVDGSAAVRPEAVRGQYRSGAATFAELQYPGDNPLRNSLYGSLCGHKIPRALRYKDRSSMAFSRELRVPFLDHELVEFSFNLPGEFLVHDGWNKYIFREALRGRIPDSVRNAPKRSVQTPQREWLSAGPLAGKLEEILSEPSQLLDEVVDIDIARDIYRRYRAGENANSNYLWQWMNLDLWFRQFASGRFTSADATWPQARVAVTGPVTEGAPL